MKNISLLLSLFVLPFLGLAQTSALSLKVQEAKYKNPVFQQPILFQFAGQAKSANQFDDLVTDGQLLTLDLSNLKSLYQARLPTINLWLHRPY